MQPHVPPRRTAAVVLLLLASTLLSTGPAAAALVPEAPTGVVATAGERSATVSWSAPADSGSSITGYLVTVMPDGPEHAAPAGATELVVTGLDAGAAYRFTVAATNAVGTGPPSEPSAEVVLPPDTAILSGPRQGNFTTTRRARLTWGSEGEVADHRCTLDGRRRKCRGGSIRLRGLAPGTHAFTVAARDADGDVDPTPARRSWTVPRNDRDLHSRGAWHRGRARGAYQGTFSRSRRRGAQLTSRGIDVRKLALVATVGPRSGSVVVFLGRHRLGRFDLSAPRRRRRQLIPVVAFPSVRSGEIRVVVRSRGKPVTIEGLGVENWFTTH